MQFQEHYQNEYLFEKVLRALFNYQQSYSVQKSGLLILQIIVPFVWKNFHLLDLKTGSNSTEEIEEISKNNILNQGTVKK